ncbi:MAG: hypothetical protein ACKPEA_18745 [Planctomycetota bacterium]
MVVRTKSGLRLLIHAMTDMPPHTAYGTRAASKAAQNRCARSRMHDMV